MKEKKEKKENKEQSEGGAASCLHHGIGVTSCTVPYGTYDLSPSCPGCLLTHPLAAFPPRHMRKCPVSPSSHANEATIDSKAVGKEEAAWSSQKEPALCAAAGSLGILLRVLSSIQMNWVMLFCAGHSAYASSSLGLTWDLDQHSTWGEASQLVG